MMIIFLILAFSLKTELWWVEFQSWIFPDRFSKMLIWDTVRNDSTCKDNDWTWCFLWREAKILELNGSHKSRKRWRDFKPNMEMRNIQKINVIGTSWKHYKDRNRIDSEDTDFTLEKYKKKKSG